MTSDQFRAALASIGWSGHQLSKMIGVGSSTIYRWENGRYEVPPPVAAWLLRLAAAHDRNPVPVDQARQITWARNAKLEAEP